MRKEGQGKDADDISLPVWALFGGGGTWNRRRNETALRQVPQEEPTGVLRAVVPCTSPPLQI